MNIKVKKIRENALLPRRASNKAVGYDVYSSIILDKHTKEVIGKLPVTIKSGGSVLIGIGLQLAVPFPVDCEIRPRSGLASKNDIELSNSPGTIDPDFRGEAGILLRNRGSKGFTIKEQERIAQMIFRKVEIPVFEEADELPKTIRDIGGFGSTGLGQIKEGTREFDKAIKIKDTAFMKIVLAISEMSNCVRGLKEKGVCTRKYGCVIEKEGNIISHGYNVQYKGSILCSESGCLREEEDIASGTMIERCRAVHAEWKALTNLAVSGSGSTKGATIYLNAEPCEICAKLITETEIEAMVLLKGTYPKNGTQILRKAEINIRYVDLEEKAR